MILAFLVWKAVSSLLRYDLESDKTIKFKKADTEFNDPIRPHSKSFYTYMQLAFMTTPNRQKQLVNQLSERLKETRELKYHIPQENISSNLSLLIEDPETWLKNIQQKTVVLRLNRKKITSDILYDEIFKILFSCVIIFD